MKVLVYITPESDPENLFLSLINKLIPSESLQLYTRYPDLSARLNESASNIVLAIFMIHGTQDLNSLITLENDITGIHNILIIPDLDKEKLNLAYSLFPRYISDTTDFDDLALIIKKMTHKYLPQ